MMATDLPKTMKALRYEKPESYGVTNVPLPVMRENDVLIKVKASGVCGTDLHIHEGGFLAKFPLIPGHEVVGVIAAVGPRVKGFSIGDRVVADNSELCGECFFCLRGQELFCENFEAHGVTMDGGFAEYCAYPAKKVFKIKAISDVNATLIEPASCAAHGADRIAAKAGSSVLLFGAGPTGLILAQMLKRNGGCHVVIAAPEGLKMNLAKSLDAGHGYVPLSRQDSASQLQKLKFENPRGFDIVVEATGNIKILDGSINFVRRGGKLLLYGVFADHDRVSWSPTKILNDEITTVSSFSQVYKFPTAIDYLESGQVKVDGIVNKTFTLEQWKQCLEEVRNKSRLVPVVLVWLVGCCRPDLTVRRQVLLIPSTAL